MKLVAVLIGLALIQPGSEGPSRDIAAEVKALVPELWSKSPSHQEEAEQKLLALGPGAILPLVGEVGNLGPVGVDRIMAVVAKYEPSALEMARPFIFERLVAAASQHNAQSWEVRAAICRAIGGMGDAVDPYVKALVDSGDPTRSSIGIGILYQEGPRAVEQLIPLLKHRDHYVRQNAAELLGKMADPRSKDALLESLDSDDTDVLARAPNGIAVLQDRRAIPKLLGLLAHRDHFVRAAATASLGHMYEPRLLAPLVKTARWDPEISVRQTAANVLINLSRDPVAIRLGHRYRPMTIDPGVQMTLWLFGITEQVVTALVLYFAVWMGYRAGPSIVGFLGIGFVAALLGFSWGRLLPSMTGATEWWLMFVCVPGTALVACLAGPRVRVLTPLVVGLVLSFGLALFGSAGGLTSAVVSEFVSPFVLILSMAMTVVSALWLGLRRRLDAASMSSFRRATLAGGSGFYLGYWLGWLALWGYLGL
jgi:HEAT repeats